MFLVVAVLLANAEIVWPPHSPRLAMFDQGPVFNLGHDNVALVNASAHATASALVVSMGERLAGREGMWITTGAYAGLKLIHESCLHNGRGPEVRTDLASTIGVAVATAGAFELFNKLGWLRWSM